MLRFIARIWAKLAYVFKEEVKGAENELNARAGFQRANTLTAEADAMEKRITEASDMEEKGFWFCEDGHEIPADCRCAAPGDVAVVHTTACILNDDQTCPRPNCQKPMKLLKRDTMTGQEKYESDKDREAATNLLAARRKDADDAQKAAQYFAKMAAQSREFADRLRKL